jgi:outer membrane protein assembly factor BamB
MPGPANKCAGKARDARRVKHRHTSIRPRSHILRLLILLTAAALLGGARSAGARSEPFVPTFATSPRLKEQVQRLERLAARKQWDPWLAQYQQLVDDPGDPVLEQGEGTLVGVRHHCHQLLAALPPPVRRRYRALHDGNALRLYRKAAAENDAAGMRDVYSRYRFSSHATPALQWLAARAADLGQAELARTIYSGLAAEPGASAGTLLRYALAAHSAGKPDEAQAALARVRREFGGAPVRLAGEEQPAGVAARALLQLMEPRQPASQPFWPAFAGDGTRAMEGSLADPLKRLWHFPHATISRGPSFRDRGSFQQDRLFTFLTFPVVQDGRVWVQGPRNLMALNLETGHRLWNEQDWTLTASEVAARRALETRRGSARYSPRRSFQAAPSLDRHLLATRIPLGYSSDGDFQQMMDVGLAVFDTGNSRQLWRKAAGDARGIYFNAPTIQANVLYSGIATYHGGITEYAAVSLEAGTGEPLWSTYLGAGSDAVGMVDGSPPLVKDGLAWFETSLYTLSALDLVTGDIRYVWRFDRPHLDRKGEFDEIPFLNRPITLVAAAGGAVVFSPRWSPDVVALDPATGKRVWTAPKPTTMSMLGSMFAVDERHAYISGDYVQALDLKTGKPAWTWKPGGNGASGGLPVGFPALAGGRVHVLIDGVLHTLEARTGRPLRLRNLRDGLGPSPGFASLLLLGDRLLVMTRTGVTAFGAGK